MPAAFAANIEDAGDLLELISFEIAGQEFCIDIRCVREIRGWTPATPIPHTPPYIQGVINLRGVVMPVIDLRRRLGLGVTAPTARHVIVVVQHATGPAGLLVDGVQETFQVKPSQLSPPPAVGSTGLETFIDAILTIDARLVSRLVVAALLPMDKGAPAAIERNATAPSESAGVKSVVYV